MGGCSLRTGLFDEVICRVAAADMSRVPRSRIRPLLSTATETALLYGLAGLLLGAALTSPHLALCAWLSVAAFGVALGGTRSSRAAAIIVAIGLAPPIRDGARSPPAPH